MDISSDQWEQTELGEQVRILEGPHADEVGRVVEMLESGDLIVVISILGEEQPITVGLHQVARID